MKVRSRVAVLSCIAVVVAAGPWTALSTASRSSAAAQLKTVPKIDPLSIFTLDVVVVNIPNTQAYTVDPGGVVAAQATCPKDSRKGTTSHTWTVIGGGYHMYGVNGDAVPSATAAYSADETESYKVVIANPKLASGAIRFYVEATCMDVQEGPLAG